MIRVFALLFCINLILMGLHASSIFNDSISNDKKDLINLDEVIVVAFGLENKEKSLGYAVTRLQQDDIDNNSINFVSALQGKVAGLNISGLNGGLAGRMKIGIRGASTLNKDNQPLIIIDGIALNSSVFDSSPDWTGNTDDFGDELKNLNIADIENISILKGAASTALYGSRGLNGAIVVTTKKSNYQKDFSVTVSQSIGFDVVTATPDLQIIYGPGTIAGNITYGERDANGDFSRWDTRQFYLNSTGNPTLVGADGMGWGPKFDGRPIISYDGSFISYSPQTDNYKDFYDAGFNSNTNIIIQGGNNKTTFYLSGGHRLAEGTLPDNSFNRTSFMLKGSYRINNRIEVRANVALAYSRIENRQPNVGDFFINRMVNTLYDSRYYRSKYKAPHGGIANINYGDKYADAPIKDLWWQIYEIKHKQKELSVRPSVNMDMKLTDWLNFGIEANMDIYTANKDYKRLGSGYKNEGTDDNSGGMYQLIKNKRNEETLSATLTLKKQIQDFAFSGFLRGEFRNATSEQTQKQTTGGLEVPELFTIANSRNTPYIKHLTTYNKRVLSIASAFNAGWKEQVWLDFTGRNDWSSSLVYSNGTGNYSYFYPSISTTWVMSETFKKQLPSWISFAKLRLSWAQVGNDADPFVINPGYDQTKYVQADGSYIYADIVPSILYGQNGRLKPERKNAWEVGTDMRFWDGRIALDVSLYKENTKNQIMKITLPKESGVGYQMVNAGNIQNKGIEIALNTKPIYKEDWKWDIGFTYSKNQNKIISLHPNVQDHIVLSGQIDAGNYRMASVAIAGGDYGVLMSDIMPERDENGNIVLLWAEENRTAYPKRSDKVGYVGKITPDFTSSVFSGIQYKDFSLKALFDFRYGGLIASYSNRYGTAYGITASSLPYRDSASGGITWTSNYADSKGMQFSDGVIPEGVFAGGTVITTPSGERLDVSGMSFRDAYEKGYVEPVHASDYHFFNNGWSTGTVNSNWVNEVKYIAVREISLGYKIPSTVSAKLGAKNINILFSAHNLGYLYNSLPNNLHPESVAGTATTDFRERGFIPYTASFMGTITLGF